MNACRLFATVALALALIAPAALADSAGDILDAAGVSGGLVVHVGCGDGKLTAALRADDGYLVHGLDADAKHVAAAREHIRGKGLYGPVAVERWVGPKLPYVDALVNLLVLDGAKVPDTEALRVLAPRGVAMVREGSGWRKLIKPVADVADDWSHFLHDAGGNAVSSDPRIGPPKRLRWLAPPRWCRSHEMPSSINAVVTTGGRTFTIVDEGVTGVYEKLPWNCKLVARDAANGKLLWKRPMRRWQPEFGTGKGNRWNIHHTIPRRLVADSDRVYVTPAFLDSPVSVLDAAGGKVLVEALPGTKGTDEMLLTDGVLLVKTRDGRSVGASARMGGNGTPDALAAVDVRTGKLLWEKKGLHVVPYALAAADGRAVYHTPKELVCLDLRTGEEAWRDADPMGRPQGGTSTLVITDGVVLFHGQAKPDAKNAADKKAKRKRRRRGGAFFITARRLADGERMWRHRGARAWAAACTQPTDLFVCDGMVFCGTLAGRDLKTGEVRKKIEVGKLISPGHHYRCHRSKATERFLILPKRGAEFVDIAGEGHMRNDWLRAPCFTGLTPANGLLYVPSSQCFCYPGVKVSGFLAMAAEPAEPVTVSGTGALLRGPAYGKAMSGPAADEPSADDWPMHRRDGARSGATPAPVGAKVAQSWAVELDGRGTQPAVVGDLLVLAERDRHRVRGLDAATGKGIWAHTAGGRVDSAPTIHKGTVLFGCRDGSVTCLRADDGELVWRFRAAPTRRLVAFEQIESVWPVHGSVLVRDGVAYFAAGRSSFLDGGLLVYGLDAATGKVLHHHRLEGPWPDVKTETGRPFAMEGALPDLLVAAGDHLFMQRIKFDAKLNRLPAKRESDLGELDMGTPHLVATGGFLDDTGFDRLYWMHSHRWPGFYFAQQAPKAGQLVVFNDSTTYAVKYFYRRIQWSPAFFPAEHGYLLFADDIDNEPALDEKGKKVAIEWLPPEAAKDRHRRGGRGVEKGTGYVRTRPAKWQKMVPLRVRAMVLTGENLFAAGTPDVLDGDDPAAAFEGRKGARLDTYRADTGDRLATLKLPAPPEFDTLIAARGRLYVVTQDGKLRCFAEKR